MYPELLTLVTTGLGTASAVAEFLERIQTQISAVDYKRTLTEVVEAHVLSSEYCGGSKQLALEHLEQRSSVRDELLGAAKADEFASCLKRMDVLAQATPTEAEGFLLQTLEALAYAFGASRQDRILRGDLALVSAQVQRSSEIVEQLADVLVERVSGFDSSLGSLTLESIPSDKSSPAINHLLDDFPLLVPWSERLEYATSYYAQLSDEGPDFEAYTRLIAEARNGVATDLTSEIENIAVLGVEGEPAKALERLELIEERLPPHDLYKQTIYYRLRGTLLLEIGRVPAAAEAFARARRVLDKVNDKQKQSRAFMWLDRKLRFDELNMRANSFGRKFWQKDYEAARAIPAWPTHPAVDRAVCEFHRVLAKESFEVSVKQESTYRSSNFLQEALLHFNRALLLAYLSGDHVSVRAIRWEFAQGLVALPGNFWNDAYVKLFVDELLRTGDANAIAQFLRVYADHLAEVYNWSDVIARMKPRDPADHDLGAYGWVRSRLAVIEAMSPYLPEATLEQLNEEFTNEAVAFLVSSRHGMVRGYSFRESYFIDAFKSIENLTPTLLKKLVVALDNFASSRGLSFWEVVAVHDWRDKDRNTAEMVIEQLQGKTLGYFDGGEVISHIMWRLSVTFPDLRPQAEGWLTANAAVDENTKADSYGYFLTTGWAEFTPDIKTWIQDIYKEHLELLKGASHTERVIGTRRILLLPSAVRKFPKIFLADELFDMATCLLEAAENPNGSPVQKVDVFHVVFDLMSSLTDDQRVKVCEWLTSSGDAPGRARDLHEIVGFGFSQTAAQASLIRLRTAVGISPTPSDLTFILQGFTTDVRSETLSEFYGAAEALIQRGNHEETLLFALLSATSNNPKRPRAVIAAARVLVRNVPPPSAPLYEAVVQRLEGLMADSVPPVMRAIIGQMIESWTSLPAEVKPRFLAKAVDIKADHRNRFARAWAGELLGKDAYSES